MPFITTLSMSRRGLRESRRPTTSTASTQSAALIANSSVNQIRTVVDISPSPIQSQDV